MKHDWNYSAPKESHAEHLHAKLSQNAITTNDHLAMFKRGRAALASLIVENIVGELSYLRSTE